MSRISHRWDLTPAAARALQTRLCRQVERSDRLATIRIVAGVDVGFRDGGRITRAAVALLEYPSLTRLDFEVFEQATAFPYVPGLLSFREVPAILQAFARLAVRPDVIFCDGQGYAHPRRFGLACHLGLWLDRPTIGVAKSRLIGEFAMPGVERGAYGCLTDGREIIGRVVRTRSRVKPLFVSSGHRISLATASRMVLNCATRYRLPEPTRWADRLASRR
jgi:deoxyribonuclease V